MVTVSACVQAIAGTCNLPATNFLGFCFVTTTAVLNETANALSEPCFRQSVVEFYNRLQISSRVNIVFVDKSLWDKGWKLYEQRPDKGWSLTDCVSFEVIQQQRLEAALTNDKHFEQAGFQALLRKMHIKHS
ncbi:MAG: PIN domain-containing protein [Deltaproteobacteria bacterium]|nr:PIN domain-containing protein [Deltaproteobacteria bacterium]